MAHFVVLFAAFIALAGGAHIAVPPKDTVVEVGSNVTLNCETYIADHEDNDNLEWKEYITAEGGYTIFNSFADDVVNRPEKFEIHGEYNLLVKDVTVEDGGMYSCKLSRSETTTNDADLLVLEQPEFLMEDMRDGENATVICKVKFGSRRPDDIESTRTPHLRLRYAGRVVEAGEEVIVPGKPGNPDDPASKVYTPSIITYTANVIAKGEHDGTNLTCEVYTKDPEFTVSVVETVEVQYFVSRVTIEPRTTTYEVGDVITCTADGNPEPQVVWTALEPVPHGVRTRRAEDNLLITHDMVSAGKQTWQCKATNIVAGEASVPVVGEHTFTVEEPQDSAGGGSAGMISLSVTTAVLSFLALYMCH